MIGLVYVVYSWFLLERHFAGRSRNNKCTVLIILSSWREGSNTLLLLHLGRTTKQATYLLVECFAS